MRKRGWMCLYLLHSEGGADLFSSKDHGALGQNLRQLEWVQSQQLADVTDHWKTYTQICCSTFIKMLRRTQHLLVSEKRCDPWTLILYKPEDIRLCWVGRGALQALYFTSSLEKRSDTANKGALSSCYSLFRTLSACAMPIKLRAITWNMGEMSDISTVDWKGLFKLPGVLLTFLFKSPCNHAWKKCCLTLD